MQSGFDIKRGRSRKLPLVRSDPLRPNCGPSTLFVRLRKVPLNFLSVDEVLRRQDRHRSRRPRDPGALGLGLHERLRGVHAITATTASARSATAAAKSSFFDRALARPRRALRRRGLSSAPPLRLPGRSARGRASAAARARSRPARRAATTEGVGNVGIAEAAEVTNCAVPDSVMAKVSLSIPIVVLVDFAPDEVG